MPLFYCTKWRSGQVLPMPDRLTDSQRKDSATQLLIKYKSGALVTQLGNIRQSHLSSDKVSNHPCPSSVGLQRAVSGVLIQDIDYIIRIAVSHQAFIRPLISTCIILDRLKWYPSKKSCLFVPKVIGQEQRVVEVHSKRMKIPIHSKQGLSSHLKYLFRASLKPASHLL